MATGSSTVDYPIKSVSRHTLFLWRGMLSPQRTFWKDVPTHENLADPLPGTSTSACPVISSHTHFPTYPPVGKKLSLFYFPWRTPKAPWILERVSA